MDSLPWSFFISLKEQLVTWKCVLRHWVSICCSGELILFTVSVCTELVSLICQIISLKSSLIVINMNRISFYQKLVFCVQCDRDTVQTYKEHGEG